MAGRLRRSAAKLGPALSIALFLSAGDEPSPRNAVAFAEPHRSRIDGRGDACPDGRALPNMPQHQRRWVTAKPRPGSPTSFPSPPTKSRPAHRSFDWIVPKEWNIRDAYIKDSAGRRVIDFQKNNLHVVNYSAPVNARMTLDELLPRLHSLPERPDWIPYRTSYYAESWGFCLSHRQLQGLVPDEYEVVIDSTLKDGAITYGECVLPGQSEEEFLISTHACHPSLANDNLSGVALAATLARILAPIPRRYTYRFLFVPGTIGAIAWLFRNQATVKRVKHGLVLACVGDRGATQLQAQQAAERRYRPGRRACAQDQGCALRDQGLFALRLRRKAILLAGVQSSRGKLPPHTAWRVSRVPHLGRQSRLRVGAPSCRFARHAARSHRPVGERPPLREFEPHGRAAARAKGIGAVARRQDGRRTISLRCCGSSISPTARMAFSISPSARACRLTRSAAPSMRSRLAACSIAPARAAQISQ